MAHDYLLECGVFTPDLIEMWVAFKRRYCMYMRSDRLEPEEASVTVSELARNVAALIRRAETGDLMIAATAIATGRTLVTADEGFSVISGLKAGRPMR